MKLTEFRKLIREMIEEALQEKWEDSKDTKVKSTGEHADKSVEQIRKEMDALKGKKPFDREKYSSLQFALRAKEGWKKGKGAVTGKK